MPDSPLALLTPSEAAQRLRICERSLRKLRQRGEIAFVQLIGRRIAYTIEACDAFVEAHTFTAPPKLPRGSARQPADRSVEAAFEVMLAKRRKRERRRARSSTSFV